MDVMGKEQRPMASVTSHMSKTESSPSHDLLLYFV